jgi:hypothetical protein
MSFILGKKSEKRKFLEKPTFFAFENSLSVIRDGIPTFFHSKKIVYNKD